MRDQVADTGNDALRVLDLVHGTVRSRGRGGEARRGDRSPRALREEPGGVSGFALRVGSAAKKDRKEATPGDAREANALKHP